ncbi:putative RNA-binding protein [Cyphellophora attinorum]|uniref:Putative RNA-binding protein n=1 Tax=Cyphellophora attinorum TaxID=1664694 RepID=A0A0N1P249_9EURO|nr:putative RNA-binding protein [Phialophora attinorum]KPI41836.1 putative RNA-binding protein [Phialophora attinorum]
MDSSSKRRKLSNGAAASTILAEPQATTTKDTNSDLASTTKPTAETKTRSSSLFVRSLPASVTNESLAAHFSESYPLKHATVVLDPSTKISRGFGFVTFTDHADAAAAAAEFDGSTLLGRKIRVEIAEARHRDGAAGGDLAVTNGGAVAVDAGSERSERRKVGNSKSTNTTGERLRKEREDQRKESQPPRLIVRNLPWSIQTSEDLTKLFQSYGKVKHAVVPKKGGKGEGYGFGIVILRGRKNAERALEGVNGKEVDGRVVAVDWMAEKEEWEKVKEIEAQSAAEMGINGKSGVEKQTANGVEDAKGDVDMQDVAEDEHIDDSDSDADEGASLPSNPSGAEEDNLIDPSADLPDLEDKPSTDNTTIFIRNLPFTTDDATLREHFTTHFGPTRYARVVYDHATERSKGTGFVNFVEESDAKDCVRGAPKKLDSDPSGSVLNRNRHGPQSTHSILQNDASDPSGKYTLEGRILQITRFLPKPTADALASQSALSREKARERDKRRLYLLSEGTIPRNSKLYEMLSKPELDMREASAKQRQRLIKMNPNLGISLTRLSIRNLPRWVTSKDLKQLAREAVVGFASDCKAGKRSALSAEENRRAADLMAELETQRKKKGVGIVRQAKIVFEDSKQGSKVKEGMGGRSRGYGFVEYWSHRSALAGLRWLNGYVLKPKEGGEGEGERGKRLIVEFAIENAQVVQRREGREKRGRERRDGGEGEWEGIEDDEQAAGTKGMGKRLSGAQQKKRKREASANGNSVKSSDGGKKGKSSHTETEAAGSPDEKNKLAKRNRIIAKKRSARKARKG